MSGERGIEIEAWFNESPHAVFDAWTDPRQLAAWFAAGDWQVYRVDFNAVVGARWRIDFQHPSGDQYFEEGVILQVVPSELLVFTLTQVGLQPRTFETRVSVSFEGSHGGTRVRFRQVGFPSDAFRDANREGWRSCIDKLCEHMRLSSKSEISRRS